jgi:hypothetical protein
VLLCNGQLNREITDNYRGNKSLSHARGAYLRLELPFVLESNAVSDTWVLYLDVDTMFQSPFTDPEIFPDLVAGAPDFRKDNWNFISTGVLVLNLPGLSKVHPAFLNYIRSNDFAFENSGMGPCDQGAWNKFFGRNFERLPLEYNWKPFWGTNENVKIVHFVGPNPFEAGDHLVRNESRSENHWSETHRRCIDKDPLAYFTFLKEWHRLAQSVLMPNENILIRRVQKLGDQLDSFGTSTR